MNPNLLYWAAALGRNEGVTLAQEAVIKKIISYTNAMDAR